MMRAKIPGQVALDLEIPAQFPLQTLENPDKVQAEFVKLANDYDKELNQQDPWEHSEYRWIRALPPAARATAAHTLLHRWLTAAGVPTGNTHKSKGCDLHLPTQARPHTKIITSTLWSGGEFNFQGLATSTYDTLALFGIAPHRIYLWVLPQTTAVEHLNKSSWLTISIPNTPNWLAPYGGELGPATKLLLPKEK